MFTGIIEATAVILHATSSGLTIARPPIFDDVRHGSSVCVSGVCLTVTALDAMTLSFDVIPETWERTTLGDLQPGKSVNLERALRADGRLDGHIVQGHIEGVGEILTIAPSPDPTVSTHHTLEVSLPKLLHPFVIPKGSITIDGVSLTVAALKEKSCILALIPTTLRETTLGTLRIGDHVNMETDMIVRSLASLLPRP